MEDDGVLARRLRQLLTRLIRSMGVLERGDAACCGVTLAQCHALGLVAAREGLTAGELATLLGVDPSAVTRVADDLVRLGLLRREGDPGDRRVVRLFLTAAGRSFWERAEDVMMQRSRAVMNRLSPGERWPVLTALERLVEALEQEGYLPRCGDEGRREREG